MHHISTVPAYCCNLTRSSSFSQLGMLHLCSFDTHKITCSEDFWLLILQSSMSNTGLTKQDRLSIGRRANEILSYSGGAPGKCRFLSFLSRG